MSAVTDHEHGLILGVSQQLQKTIIADSTQELLLQDAEQ